MQKRILVAESSETIRNLAETSLRENGIEVLSVADGKRAMEVLQFTNPDMILLSADLTTSGDKKLLDEIQDNPKYQNIPYVVMKSPDSPDLMLPEEIVLNKPFDPKRLLELINTFTNGGASNSQKAQASSNNPLGKGSVDDEFLDAALGLDRLEVTESEVMDKTTKVKAGAKSTVEKMIGFDLPSDSTDIPIKKNEDSGKVESLMIRDKDDLDPKQKKQETSSNLEILNDQYGLTQPDQLNSPQADSDHDYNWFLNELQKENNSPAGQKTSKPDTKNISDSQKLDFTDNSSVVDPITPPPSNKQKNSTSGVDHFIDEFKKEVEKISGDMPDSVTIPPENLSDSQKLNWEESVEKITPQTIAAFKEQFVKELAAQVAEKISQKIDADKLLLLLKQEIIKQFQK